VPRRVNGFAAQSVAATKNLKLLQEIKRRRDERSWERRGGVESGPVAFHGRKVRGDVDGRRRDGREEAQEARGALREG